jgi:hypothetical protein
VPVPAARAAAAVVLRAAVAPLVAAAAPVIPACTYPPVGHSLCNGRTGAPRVMGPWQQGRGARCRRCYACCPAQSPKATPAASPILVVVVPSPGVTPLAFPVPSMVLLVSPLIAPVVLTCSARRLVASVALPLLMAASLVVLATWFVQANQAVCQGHGKGSTSSRQRVTRSSARQAGSRTAMEDHLAAHGSLCLLLLAFRGFQEGCSSWVSEQHGRLIEACKALLPICFGLPGVLRSTRARMRPPVWALQAHHLLLTRPWLRRCAGQGCLGHLDDRGGLLRPVARCPRRAARSNRSRKDVCAQSGLERACCRPYGHPPGRNLPQPRLRPSSRRLQWTPPQPAQALQTTHHAVKTQLSPPLM